MTHRRFFTLDVFTNTPLAGNPLAVVLDCAGLDTEAMLAITKEFNLSETVFVLPPTDPVNTAAIRIFTPGGELPFAGHPTVGTAILLAHVNAPDAARGVGGIVIALEEKIGLISVDVTHHEQNGMRAVFALPRRSERLATSIDRQAAATALGLDVDDIDLPGHELSVWSAGVPFNMVPVRNLAAIGRARIADPQSWEQAFAASDHRSVYVYTNETFDPRNHVHARMFSPGMGLSEDPATGSAAAAFSGLAAAFERPEDGRHQIVIEQGYEMGRPSEIVLDLEISCGAALSASIGGNAVIMSQGRLYI